MTTKTVSIRADADLLARIDEIAASQDRSRNWWINRQLEEAIAEEVQFSDLLIQSIADADSGRVSAHETVISELRSKLSDR